MVTENRNTEVITKEPMEIQTAAKLTEQGIASISEQMNLAEKLVTTLMKFGVDYGVTPGTKGPGLWDAGSAKVIRAFRLFPDQTVLEHIENEDLISYVIKVHLVNQTGEIFGSGLGAASTRETKYKYRWVDKAEAKREGYTDEDIANLKTREWDDKLTYRIENPDYGELVNTILTMAAKRAEVDAARGLPGVGGALKEAFNNMDKKGNKTNKQPENKLSGQEDLTLPVFWSMVKGGGLSEVDAHNILKVASMNDWLASGKTLRDGIQEILKISVGAARSRKKTPQSGTEPAPKIKVEVKEKTAGEITAADVRTADDLIFLVKQFYNFEEQALFASLSYKDKANFIDAGVETPYGAWVKIRNSQKITLK